MLDFSNHHFPATLKLVHRGSERNWFKRCRRICICIIQSICKSSFANTSNLLLHSVPKIVNINAFDMDTKICLESGIKEWLLNLPQQWVNLRLKPNLLLQTLFPYDIYTISALVKFSGLCEIYWLIDIMAVLTHIKLAYPDLTKSDITKAPTSSALVLPRAFMGHPSLFRPTVC